jgi:hypothetical protein
MASNSFLYLFVFIIFVALPNGFAINNSTNIPIPSTTLEHSSSEVENGINTSRSVVICTEFIVTFKEYMKQTEHLKFLVNLIGGNVGWEIIKRDNPAKNLPSDFSLIKVNT